MSDDAGDEQVPVLCDTCFVINESLFQASSENTEQPYFHGSLGDWFNSASRCDLCKLLLYGHLRERKEFRDLVADLTSFVDVFATRDSILDAERLHLHSDDKSRPGQPGYPLVLYLQPHQFREPSHTQGSVVQEGFYSMLLYRSTGPSPIDEDRAYFRITSGTGKL